jgi:molecular chaperone GrpE
MPSSRVSDADADAAAQAAPATEAPAQEQTEDLQARCAALEDRYKRALADLDNYRKRAAREIERRVSESRELQLREWLPAVDSVERALKMAQDPAAHEGLRAVLEQMEAILRREGATRIGEPGEAFDPERHEAIGVRETGEQPDRTVLDVVQSGYALGDRVIRPAQVIVSRRPERAATAGA